MDLLLPIVVFLFTVALVAAIASLTRPRAAAERLQRLGARGAEPRTESESLLVSHEPGAAVRALQALGRRLQSDEAGALRKRLIHSG